MQLDWHECRKPDLACAINTVPLDGWVCFPQAEWINRVQCVLQKAGSETWGELLSLPLLPPVQSLLWITLRGRQEWAVCASGRAWAEHETENFVIYIPTGSVLTFLEFLYIVVFWGHCGSIHFCDTRVKWSLTIYCPLEKITQTQPK